MRKKTALHFLRIIFVLSVLLGTISVSAGCSQGAANPPTDSADRTGTVPTGPDRVNELKLASSELLTELLDFKWEDVRSVTLIKYQDATRVSTVRIEDSEKLQSIGDLCDKMSVIHAISAETAVPEENIVYEIYLDAQVYEDGSEVFLSIGPSFEDQNFSIGGSFIKAQSLNPRIPLLQTNTFVPFADVESDFDPMLDVE